MLRSAKMYDTAQFSKLPPTKKDILLAQLLQERDLYKNKLEKVEQERDGLLCEVNRLKFELQISDIKRFCEEDKYDTRDLLNTTSNAVTNGGYVNGASIFKSSSSGLKHDNRGLPCHGTTNGSRCGPASHQSPNGGLIKAHSSEGPHGGPIYANPPLNPLHNMHRRPQALSQSALTNGRRVGGAVDDSGGQVRGGADRWGRRQNNANGENAYELSQDLADKRIEMLERRYGGDQARRAATTIQRAYRHYAMTKKFRAITATAKAQERRYSKRFGGEESHYGGDHPEQFIRKEFDQLNKNLNDSVYGDNRGSRSSRSRKSGTSRTTDDIPEDVDEPHYSTIGSPTHSPNNNISSPKITPSSSSVALNSSVATEDITSLGVSKPSINLDTCNSPKELKYFSSEDSGFGSHDGSAHAGGLAVSSGGRRGPKGVPPGPMGGKKYPPDIPRRSSSIKSNESGQSQDRCIDNGSLSSVQSSGSDSSLSHSDRATPHGDSVDQFPEGGPSSPVWKRKHQHMSTSELIYDDKRLSNISENSEDSCQSHSSDRLTYSNTAPSANSNKYPPHYTTVTLPKVPEVLRKRQYRVGLNLFNKKPEKGISYLISRFFLENSPLGVAKFLLTRKGLSKQMIGEYLGNLQNSFNMAVLETFSQEIDLSGMQVDVALRKYQTYFRLPGEAQKIERIMEVFAQRYCQCNRDIIAKLRDPQTIFVLAFAIIMLNTDLHTASMKPEKRMKMEDFIKNLRGVDDGCDIEREMLEGMYHRIKAQEYKTGHDHVTQVIKVQQTMVEKRPNLALPHRRLVCYCRLYEVPDVTKKERVGVHQREVFLFNDLLVVTKIFSKKKNSVTYSFRQSFPLAGLTVTNKEITHYQHLIEIKQRVDNKVLMIFNARNEHDRSKFCEDLKESIAEMDEMENLRIESELEKSKASLRSSRPTSTAENRDSGVADMETISTGSDKSNLLSADTANGTLSVGTLKRTTLSNSLIDMHQAGL